MVANNPSTEEVTLEAFIQRQVVERKTQIRLLDNESSYPRKQNAHIVAQELGEDNGRAGSISFRPNDQEEARSVAALFARSGINTSLDEERGAPILRVSPENAVEVNGMIVAADNKLRSMLPPEPEKLAVVLSPPNYDEKLLPEGSPGGLDNRLDQAIGNMQPKEEKPLSYKQGQHPEDKTMDTPTFDKTLVEAAKEGGLDAIAGLQYLREVADKNNGGGRGR